HHGDKCGPMRNRYVCSNYCQCYVAIAEKVTCGGHATHWQKEGIVERYTWLRPRRGSSAPARAVLALGAVVLALLLPGAVGAAAPRAQGTGAKTANAQARGATGSQKAHTAVARKGMTAHITPTRTAPKLTRKQVRGIQEMNEEEGDQLPAVHPYRGPMPRAVG